MLIPRNNGGQDPIPQTTGYALSAGDDRTIRYLDLTDFKKSEIISSPHTFNKKDVSYSESDKVVTETYMREGGQVDADVQAH